MLRWFQLVTLATLGIFIWYMLSRNALSALQPVRNLESKTGFVRRFLRRIGIEPRLNSNNLGPVMLFVVFLLCAGILLFSPVWIARWFPRSLAVPLLLGAWVPFLSLLSGIGRHYRCPIQILLHQQTEEYKNQNKNPDQLERVWRAITSKSDCTR